MPLPARWDKYRWEFLTNWKRFVSVILLLIVFSIVELNAFFLKYVLWIPPPNSLNVIRLFLWFGIAMPALREFYQYVVDPTYTKFGTMSWLCCAIAGAEALVWLKFAKGMFPPIWKWPPEVLWSWSIVIASVAAFGFVYFGIKGAPKSKTKSN